MLKYEIKKTDKNERGKKRIGMKKKKKQKQKATSFDVHTSILARVSPRVGSFFFNVKKY
jgi:hypothetical protein